MFPDFSLLSCLYSEFTVPNEGSISQGTETIVKTRDESTAKVLCEHVSVENSACFFYLNECFEDEKKEYAASGGDGY
jgi:hypothetical protein